LADTAVPRKRRRFAPVLIVASLAAGVVLSLSITGTTSAFIASITNSNNTAGTGSIVLQESGPNSTGTPVSCTSTDATTIGVNSSTCSTINKYGGNLGMVPTNAAGTTNLVSTTVTFKNTGTSAAGSFTLVPGTCTQSANGLPAGTATDLCSKINVSISSNGVVFKTTTAAALASGGSIALPNVPAAGGAAVTFVFTVSLDNSAGNTYQNLAASQPLAWNLSS